MSTLRYMFCLFSDAEYKLHSSFPMVIVLCSSVKSNLTYQPMFIHFAAMNWRYNLMHKYFQSQAEKGKPNYIAKIVEFFEAIDGEPYFRARWFYRPEDTVRMLLRLSLLDFCCSLVQLSHI